MANKEALIIFLRNPELGKVKTRLARTMGDEHALLVYRHLLEHTRSITKDLSCDKFVFYSDYINEMDEWDNSVYQKRLQSGGDLGEKMGQAFSGLWNKSYEQITVIGSDCFELSRETITRAFEKLAEFPVIIGPARDGGYYLLGLTRPIPEIFRGIPWGTNRVLTDTLRILKRLLLPRYLLPALGDVDREEDLPAALRKK